MSFPLSLFPALQTLSVWKRSSLAPLWGREVAVPPSGIAHSQQCLIRGRRSLLCVFMSECICIHIGPKVEVMGIESWLAYLVTIIFLKTTQQIIIWIIAWESCAVTSDYKVTFKPTLKEKLLVLQAKKTTCEMWNSSVGVWKPSSWATEEMLCIVHENQTSRWSQTSFLSLVCSETNRKPTNFCLITLREVFPKIISLMFLRVSLKLNQALLGLNRDVKSLAKRFFFWLRCDFYKQERWLTPAGRQSNVSQSAHSCLGLQKTGRWSRKEWRKIDFIGGEKNGLESKRKLEIAWHLVHVKLSMTECCRLWTSVKATLSDWTLSVLMKLKVLNSLTRSSGFYLCKAIQWA